MLDEAEALSPENEDVATLKGSIEKLHAQYALIGHDWRRIGDSDEQITTVEGKFRVTNRFEMGARVQNNEVDASQVRRSDTGAIEDFETDKQRAEVYGAYYFANGDRLQASLFANNDTGGAGVYYDFKNDLGRTELIGEYHRPYWDFVEAVTEDAVRDRVGLTHVTNITPNTTVSGEASVNMYHVDEESEAASSVLVRANITHALQQQDPYLAVGYGFDGEYMIDKEKRRLANGDEYSPFPITAREIHFLSGIVRDDLTDTTQAELVGGYAYDRLGGHGPQVSGKITQEITDNLEAQIRASYGLVTQDTDQNVTTVGGHMKVNF